ncbi:hypothetical protein C0Q70_10140 [Pomacea canaliculata]|uniref:Uncharacterized protein n=1 Tax=Pomacea canaliculata TaxID=400727 RepID=A0A2T7PBS0_POMCA|nr:hypothetical protein C0Q70_10140 [Pomacea canaliculata]
MMASEEKNETADDVRQSLSDGDWVTRRQRGQWQCQDLRPDAAGVAVEMQKDCGGARGEFDTRDGESIATRSKVDAELLGEEYDSKRNYEEDPDVNALYCRAGRKANKGVISCGQREVHNARFELQCLPTVQTIKANNNFCTRGERKLCAICSSQVKVDGHGGDKTETVAIAVIACIVLFPYVMLWWSSPDTAWPALEVLWRLAFQSIAVAFATGLTLIGLQVHFSGLFFRRWVAWFFQLKIDADSHIPDDVAEAKADMSSPDKITEVVGGNVSPAGRDNMMDACTVNSTHSAASQTEPADSTPPKTGNREKSYKKAIKKLYRKFLLIRRKCQSEMVGLRRTDREASDFLSRVQMALPGLERDKQALLAELEAIEKQYEEEKRRNHDLLSRLQPCSQSPEIAISKLSFIAPVAMATQQHPSALQAQSFLQVQATRTQQHFPHLQAISLVQSPVVQTAPPQQQQQQQQKTQASVQVKCRNGTQLVGQSPALRPAPPQPK